MPLEGTALGMALPLHSMAPTTNPLARRHHALIDAPLFYFVMS